MTSYLPAEESFEIKIRQWKDDPEAVLEDHSDGDWIYVPIDNILAGFTKNKIRFHETPQGVAIMDPASSLKYSLAGQRPYWIDEKELEGFEEIRKLGEYMSPGSPGNTTILDPPRYIEYGTVGLYAPDKKLVVHDEKTANIVRIFASSVLRTTMDFYKGMELPYDEWEHSLEDL